MTETKHTKLPWRWHGDDYRGDWGWQILVGPDGEGIIIGQGDDGGPSEHCRAFMPAAPSVCITGMMAHDKPHVNAVHVYSEANAKFLVTACNAHDQLVEALERIRDIASYGTSEIARMALESVGRNG